MIRGEIDPTIVNPQNLTGGFTNLAYLLPHNPVVRQVLVASHGGGHPLKLIPEVYSKDCSSHENQG